MTDLDLLYTPAVNLAASIRRGELSPTELMRQSLARIEAVNPALNCFCYVYGEEAMDAASKAEQAILNGRETGPLHGLPVAIKDVTPIAGKPLTLGSRVYEHHVPDRTSLLVERLQQAGAIVIGKTTTPEFAYSSFTRSPLWGETCNPWDITRSPGGSSGGSAAAVASGCVPLAEGTDMGGSVRIPASFCGLVGLKPSLGRIPMDILPTVFDNISHFGPLARNVADANLFMNAVSGPDERDIMSNPATLQFPVPANTDVRGLRIALSMDFGYMAVDNEVAAAMESAANILRDQGAGVEPVELGWTRRYQDTWLDIWGVYLGACFARDFDHWKDRMDPALAELIERGREIDAVTHKSFEFVRSEQWHSLCGVFEQYDALICPTMARTAPGNDRPESDFDVEDDNGKLMGLDMTGVFNNVAQCPALSVPAGFSGKGLPIGLQAVGHRFDDLTVMRIGAALESVLHLDQRHPTL